MVRLVAVILEAIVACASAAAFSTYSLRSRHHFRPDFESLLDKTCAAGGAVIKDDLHWRSARAITSKTPRDADVRTVQFKTLTQSFLQCKREGFDRLWRDYWSGNEAMASEFVTVGNIGVHIYALTICGIS